MEYEVLRLKGTKLYVLDGEVIFDQLHVTLIDNPYTAKKFFGGDLNDNPLLKYCERVKITLSVVE